LGALLARAWRWLAWKAALLVLILALLAGWAWLGGELKRAGELNMERAAMAAERDALQRRIATLRRSVDERTRRVAAVARGSEEALAQKRAEREAVRAAHPLMRGVPLSEPWQRIRLLDAEIALLQDLVSREEQAKAIWAKGVSAELSQREGDVAQATGRIAAIDAELARSFVARTASVVQRELPLALVILAGIILAPTAIKLFLYYGIAPLAAGRPPIRLLPAAAGAVRAGQGSGVSLPLVLGEREELLIQASYLQSSALRAQKRTRWLLNARLPFSSLLSGMYLLTRVGPAGGEPVVISATRDPHSEVGLIELGEGAAFVCQPRCLAGVVQDPDRPIRITRHWRVFSIHAWLTLQLRFLVFHGPGKLILKGGRGIRVEAPGGGRLINQALTLGFSAQLDYACTRCETFVAYWLGREGLFNDLFSGEGVYVCEEAPDPRHADASGRRLEGFGDAVLKIFGV
jgi:hypothetical protein